MKKSLIILSVAVLPFFASAQGSSRDPVLLGPPNCEAWLSGPTDPQKQWVLGFMSGLNALHTIADQLPANPIERVGSAEQIYTKVSEECRRLGLQANAAMAGVNVFLRAMREALTKPA